jgi:hypothetical protein
MVLQSVEALLERLRLGLIRLVLSALLYKLVKRRHWFVLLFFGNKCLYTTGFPGVCM